MDADELTLSRFLEAQEDTYLAALGEIRKGKKVGHWMWYIFPQLKGLGSSETSRFFGISNKKEADQYLKHQILGDRLIEISKELLALAEKDPIKIFGPVDAQKLRSCMTLFSILNGTHPVFQQVIDKVFKGQKDEATLRLLQS